MKTAIVYYSEHHGNTKKLIDAVTTPDTTLIDVTKTDTADVTLDGKVCEDKPEEPVTPPELPKTGAENVLSAMVAIAGLTTATAYYIASRKK